MIGTDPDATPPSEAQSALSTDVSGDFGALELQLAQKLAHVGSWSWDVSQNIVRWSDELHRIYGISPEVFGATYEAFIALVIEADRARTREIIAEAIRTRSDFDYEHRVRRSDGVARLLRTRGAVISTAHGEVRGVVGACWDVTEQTGQTQQLRDSLAMLQSTLESVADGVLVVDQEPHVVTRNEQFIRMWRIPSDVAQSSSDRVLLQAASEQLEAPQAFLARVRELYDRREEASFETLEFKDGRTFERRTRPYRFGDRQLGRVWTFRDVTGERRLLAQAVFLADASRLLATLDAEAGMQAVVRSMVPLLAGACACDVTGEDGSVRRIGAATVDNTPLPEPLSGGALQSPQPYVGVFRGRQWTRVPISRRGAVFGAFTFIGDLSKQMAPDTLEVAQELATRTALAIENTRLYRQTQRALHSREEFLSVVAHEIRGPLTSVRLATQALQRGGLPEEQMRRVLAMLHREDHRIAGFVDDLLELGRIQAGRFTIHLEQVNLSELAAEVVSRLTPTFTESGSQVSLNLQHAVTGTWDRTRLDQVLTNLITNAIKYGNRKPIEVEVSADAEVARIRISDQGIGIPKDRLPELFKPFERAVSSRQFGGLGLGLFIVKTIVDQLRGTVTVETELGRGSTFLVTLPRNANIV